MAITELDNIHAPQPHGLLEDIFALVVGCVLVSLGIALLKAAGLTTGGVAGIALVLSYLTDWPVALLFTLVNIPFFLIAGRIMSTRFMVKTVAANLLLLLFSTLGHSFLTISVGSVGFAAASGGIVIGMGMLALARHGAGLGGSGVVTLWLHHTRGWNAGRSQMVIDAFVLASSTIVLHLDRLIWSAVSAVVMSLVMLAWHRPGRYTGY